MTSKLNGLSNEEWAAAFRPGIKEFAAESFVFTPSANGLIRIALGNSGPVVDDIGSRAPVFHHAVTLPIPLAVELARLLLSQVAAPNEAAGHPPEHN